MTCTVPEFASTLAFMTRTYVITNHTLDGRALYTWITGLTPEQVLEIRRASAYGYLSAGPDSTTGEIVSYTATTATIAATARTIADGLHLYCDQCRPGNLISTRGERQAVLSVIRKVRTELSRQANR